MRVPCKECGARVHDTFQAKWNHTARKHPEKLVQKIIPLICTPRTAFESGQRLANYFKGKFGVV